MEVSIENVKIIYNNLQEDIQRQLMSEYIIPQLIEDECIKKFDELIESEECQCLDWTVLMDVVGKIIHNEQALNKMCKKDVLGFKEVYTNHFIHNRKTFVRFDCLLSSMCAELVMRKWH